MDLATGIQAFVRAAEHGSFTRAAHALGVTPSGIGKTIGRLESELGVRLLARTTRRITLTDDGATFFEHCRRILEDLENAKSLMSNRRATAHGRLRVSTPIAIGKLYVVPALPRFLQEHPEVRLEVSLTDRRVNLLDDGIDVALRVGALTDSSLVARTVGQQQIITVASPALLRRRKDITSPPELGDLPAVVFRMPSTGLVRPWQFTSPGTPSRVTELHPTPLISFDDGEAMVGAVRAGLGVTQVPSYMVEAELESGDLVELLPSQRPPPLPIAAVYPGQKNLPARTRVFIDFLASLRIAPKLRAPGDTTSVRRRAGPSRRRPRE